MERALTQNHRSDMPWYLRFIVGFGAWLASAFFIGFFLVLIGDQQNHRITFGVSGLVLLVLSTLLFRQNLGIFVSQCCLAASLAGQFMIYFGFLPEQHHTLGTAAVLSVGLAIVLYKLYPDTLQRLIICTAALQITLAWIYLGNNGHGFLEPADFPWPTVTLAVALYWALHLIGIAWCYLRVSRQSALLAPLGLALVLSLTAWQLENLGSIWVQNEILPVWFSNHATANFVVARWPFYLRPICTALTLFGVIVWAAGGIEKLRQFPLPFTCLAAALTALLWLGVGGVFLPLLLITLGFFVESTVMKGIGLILLPVFLFNYYYNLNLDLLAKSVTLIGSGLALLLLRAGLRRWLQVDRKETL